MIAAAPQTQSAESRRPWVPDANDHLVFHLAKFGGQKQDFVARLLGISQPTVSRIIDRYERWQAHADPREGGRLDPAERLRAQRWLTYERNELILASALRIADQMEGHTELTKTVVSRPVSQFTKEREIRSESATIDRHGIAARFLRLAFRINMEQLKLVSQDAPPLPEALTAEELARQEAEGAAIAAEFEAVARAQAEADEADRQRVTELTVADQGDLRSADSAGSGDPRRMEAEVSRQDAPADAATEATAEIIQPVNEMNNRCTEKTPAKRCAACTCNVNGPPTEFVPSPSQATLMADCALAPTPCSES